MSELETSIVWLGAIAGALSSIAALLSLAFKPLQKLKDRVSDLEEVVRVLKDELAEHQEKLNKDHHSFLLQQDVNRLLLESTSNLLKHNVDGNNTKQMMDCARRIDDLVFTRGSSIKEEL